MKLLLDTHAFIWWDSDPARLSAAAIAAMKDPANEILLSDASVWEIVIKTQLKKLTWTLPFDQVLSQHENRGIKRMPIERHHILETENLPLLHRDPIDRVPVVTARIEGVPIVSCDQDIAKHAVPTIW